MTNRNERSARLLGQSRLHDGFIKLDSLRIAIRSPAGEAEIEREVQSHGDAAVLLPVDPVRRVATLVSQFRLAPFVAGEDAWLLEAPAGLLDGDAPVVCAEREVEEETGLKVSDIQELGTTWSSPGIMVERIHLFWGVYRDPPPLRHAGLDEEAELIEVLELPLAELRAMSIDGRMADAKTALAVLRLAALEPRLFA